MTNTFNFMAKLSGLTAFAALLLMVSGYMTVPNGSMLAILSAILCAVLEGYRG